MLTYTLLTISGLVSLSRAGYTLQDDLTQGFFDNFDFFTSDDPTHGYVNYVDQNTAQAGGLVKTDNGAQYIGVDTSNAATGRGRNSVRLTSKNTYNHGLVILDLAHMPGSVCGTWPAFWMVGPSWPSNGEIDIIEGVNSQSSNAMTLHTGSGCSLSQSNDFSGKLSTSNCDVNAANQATNAGCGITSGQSNTYGDGFNANQGGVYATEWTSSSINIYFFPRGSIPSDISSSAPDPSGWGTPQASFGSASSCEIDSFFKDQQIVFDTTFCGDWAGQVWSSDSTCSAKASTCQDFVQNNPSAFQESYWSVNSLKVFSSDGASSNSSSPTSGSGGQPTISIPVSSAWPAASAAGQPSFPVPGPPGGSTQSFSFPARASSVPFPAGQSSMPAGNPFTVPATSAQPAPAQQTSGGWGNSGGWGHHTWTQNGAGGQFFATSTASIVATSGAASPETSPIAAAENPGASPTQQSTATDNPYVVVVGSGGYLAETQEAIPVITQTMTTFAVETKVAVTSVTGSAEDNSSNGNVKRDEPDLELVHRHLWHHKRRGSWRA